MKKLLVTGANGFIGRHTVGSLRDRGFDILAVTSTGAIDADMPCEWLKCDLWKRDDVASLMRRVRPEYLLHLAWDTAPGRYLVSQANYEWLKASLDLAIQFQQNGGRRILYAGTCAEYDWTTGEVMSEYSTPRRPVTAYGVCKNALRELIEHYSLTNGLSTAWAHIFYIYGPYEKDERFIPCIINSLIGGNNARCTGGNLIRDYLFVKDAGDALAALLDSHVTGPVNIASGKTVSLEGIARCIGRIMEREDLLVIGRSDSEPSVIAADTAKLNKEVGWSPRYSLEQGMRETISWWRKLRGDLYESHF